MSFNFFGVKNIFMFNKFFNIFFTFLKKNFDVKKKFTEYLRYVFSFSNCKKLSAPCPTTHHFALIASKNSAEILNLSLDKKTNENIYEISLVLSIQ